MALPDIFFADYDLHKPDYNAFAGASIQVKDAAAVLHNIGFDGSGKLDKAAADALGTDLKVTIIYDKSGHGRDAKLAAGGGDWLLRWDVRNVPYLVAQHANARFLTDASFTFNAPKVFSVAWTRDDQLNSYLWDFGGNFFACNALGQAVYDTPSYPPTLGSVYNGTFAYYPSFTPTSFPISTNETASGLHQRTVRFQAGNDLLAADGAAFPVVDNAGDAARTGQICVGNYNAGTYSGLQSFYDLKIVEGAISDADATAITNYQIVNCKVNEEHVCVVLGDSLGYGYAPLSLYAPPLPGNLSALLKGMLGPTWKVYNEAKTGATTGQLISAGYVGRAVTRYRVGKLNKVVLNGCFNDFFNDVAQAVTKANLISIIATLHGAGFEVYLRTPPRSTLNGENWKGYDAYRSNLTAWMLAGTSGADGIINETTDPHIGTGSNTNDTTYFFQTNSSAGDDHIHLRTAGYQIVANLALPFIDTPPPIAFPPEAVIDGFRHVRASWGAGGGWASEGIPSVSSPEGITIDFGVERRIYKIDVFGVADDVGSADPTLETVATLYGNVDFKIDYWNAGAWSNLRTVTGNNKVWRSFQFMPITTSKIRVLVTVAQNTFAALAEVEAWGIF